MAGVRAKTNREAIWPAGMREWNLPAPPAIRAGNWVFTSGHMAIDRYGIAPQARVDPDSPFLGNSLEMQSRHLFRNLSATLKAAGAELSRDVVRIFLWLKAAHPTYEEFLQGSSTTHISVNPYARAFHDFLNQPRPASTGMGVRDLLVTDACVQVDTIVLLPEAKAPRRAFDVPPELPQPVVKYSPALQAGDWIYLAGGLATDFKGDFMTELNMGDPSGIAPEARVNPYFWYGSSMEAQTDYLLDQLDKIAKAAGTSLERCVKADVYIGHPQDFYEIDRVWKRWFPKDPPARAMIPYMGLAARGCRIEISMVMLAGNSTLKKQTIETSQAPEPLGHAPQAVKAGDLLYFSTQLPLDSKGRVPVELRRDPVFPYQTQPSKLQMRYILKNVAAICEKAGTSLANICRSQTFYDDLAHFAPTIEELQAHFTDSPPAISAVQIGGPLFAPEAHLMLDLIGYAPS